MSVGNYNSSRITNEIRSYVAFKFVDWVDTQTPNTRLLPIGIGRGLTASPSHTTLHPPQADRAIRLIRQIQIQGNEGPSDSK